MSDYGMVLELLGLPTSAAVLVHAGGPYEDKDEIERVREMAEKNIENREHDLEEYRKANPDSMDWRQRNSGEDKAGRDRRDKEYQENYRRISSVTEAEQRKEEQDAREKERSTQPPQHAHRDAQRPAHEASRQAQQAHETAERQANAQHQGHDETRGKEKK